MADEETMPITSPPPSDTSLQQEGKGKANSGLNGNANLSSSSSDSEPTKPIKSIKLPHQYAPPGPNSDSLQSDLEDFGFEQRKVKDLMSKREFFFDATMQRPHFQTRGDRESERKRLGNGNGRSRGVGPKPNGVKPVGVATRGEQRPLKKRKVGGEGLFVGGSRNWILFDPNFHEYPVKIGHDAPALFQKFMRFEPGNTRIVEFNPASGCIRLKSTPESLDGKTIVYTKEGPKIVEAMPATIPAITKPAVATGSTVKPTTTTISTAANTTTTKLTTAITATEASADEEVKPTIESPPKRGRGSGKSRGRGGRGGRGGAINGGIPTRTSPRTRTTKVDSAYEDASPARAKRGGRGGANTRSTITVKPVKKSEPTVKVEEKDSGSESSVTGSEEKVEIADSQEGEEGVDGEV